MIQYGQETKSSPNTRKFAESVFESFDQMLKCKPNLSIIAGLHHLREQDPAVAAVNCSGCSQRIVLIGQNFCQRPAKR